MKPSRPFRETLRIAAPFLLVAAGIGGYLVLAAQRQIPVRAAEEKVVPQVATVPVTRHEGRLDIEVDGVVVPYREVAVAAEVAGRIASKADVCRAGRYVKQGTLLFEIDPRDYSLEVQRLSNEVDQAVQQIEELDVEIANAMALIELAREDLELQQRELARVEDLADRNVLTESELDNARRAELAARNALRTLENQHALLSARRARLEQSRQLAAIRLEKAELDLSRTKIIAPLDGIIVADQVEQDSFVQPGTVVVKIEDTSQAEVLTKLQTQEVFWLWYDAAAPPESSQDPASIGDPAELRLPNAYQLPPVPATVIYQVGGRQFSWQGRLARYEGTGIDEQTRTVPCRVVVPDPQKWSLWGASSESPTEAIATPGALRRGMYVRVLVHARPATEILAVPEEAIRPGNVVWTVEEGLLRIRRVRVARFVGPLALVHAATSAVAAGDRVVVSPVAFAHDGMPVRETPQP